MQLAECHAFALISLAAIACHLVFNRYEPTDPASLLILLLLVPSALGTALVPHFSSWIIAVVIAFSVYLSILCISIVLYRVSPFHPLAGYPGPILNKVSKFYMAFLGSNGKQHLFYTELHQRYGDVVRVGPNEISVCDPAAISPLMGTQGLPKGPQWEGRLMCASVPSLIAIRNPGEHAQRRKHWMRGLNSTSLKGYEPIIAKRSRQLVEHLENTEGTVTDLSQWFSHFSYDFMSDMAFGGGSEMMRDGDVCGIWDMLEDGLKGALFFANIPWAARYAHKIPWFTRDIIEFRQFGINEARRRKTEGSQSKDLFYHLIDEGAMEKEPPAFDQVLADGILAIVAGSDTTATTLSNLFYYLVSHNQVYSRLRAEVDTFYPPDDDALSTRSHGNMPYLTACINETLRLKPPVSSGSQRRAKAGAGSKMIGPYFVPEGTALFTPFYPIQRDPRNFFPAPAVFWPGRWLVADGLESPPKGFVHNTAAFTPFSYGPANCVGKSLAMQEMKMVICLMMQKLDVKKADDYDMETRWENDLKDFFVSKRGSFPVQVSRRC